MPCLVVPGFSALALLLFLSLTAQAQDPTPIDPYWSLIHDQAVLDDLKLTADQRKTWRQTLDPLDLDCFPLRNKPAAEAEPVAARLNSDAKTQIAKILRPQQSQRLDQLVVRAQGPATLLRDDLAARLKLTDKQRADIRQAVIDARDGRNKLQQDLRAARLEAAAAEKEMSKLNTAESEAINAILTNEQKQRLIPLIARDFELSKLGRTSYKTPDLIAGPSDWLNSPPLAPESLRGRVVVVHFFAFGCINCIHNYPTYRQWQDDLTGKDVQIIGIHTPETKSEHSVETLKSKLQAESLHFPVIVDNEKANWNAWGNSMWPSVYILDKHGYMRSFWAGELKFSNSRDQTWSRSAADLLNHPRRFQENGG
jgi:thiol-disulfide isomerase/thioredoxin